MDPRPLAAVFFDLGDTLVTGEDNHWIPGARELLAELHARAVRLGVISNTADLNRDQVVAALPADFPWEMFEPSLVLLSSEIGVAKPSPAIFEHALDRAGEGVCLFCTEDLRDTLVAQRVGLRTVRLLLPPNSDQGRLLNVLIRMGLLPETVQTSLKENAAMAKKPATESSTSSEDLNPILQAILQAAHFNPFLIPAEDVLHARVRG